MERSLYQAKTAVGTTTGPAVGILLRFPQPPTHQAGRKEDTPVAGVGAWAPSLPAVRGSVWGLPPSLLSGGRPTPRSANPYQTVGREPPHLWAFGLLFNCAYRIMTSV